MMWYRLPLPYKVFYHLVPFLFGKVRQKSQPSGGNKRVSLIRIQSCNCAGDDAHQ